MERFENIKTLVMATAIIWASVIVVALIGGGDFVRGVAAILALISTMTIWSLWGLDAYGISVDGTPREKPKRDAASDDDPRLSLLLSLLTPDERDALQSRLMADLNGDGESVSLADLLADQESDPHSGQAS